MAATLKNKLLFLSKDVFIKQSTGAYCRMGTLAFQYLHTQHEILEHEVQDHSTDRFPSASEPALVPPYSYAKDSSMNTRVSSGCSRADKQDMQNTSNGAMSFSSTLRNVINESARQA